MNVHTARFGELDIREQDIVQFEQGIPGFENLRRFALVIIEDHAPFSYLQSVDDGEVSFIITDPFEFFPEYECDIPEQIVEGLKIISADQVIVRVIVSINGQLESATANLLAPVIVNSGGQLGKQVVLAKTNYTTRHSLFQTSEPK